MLNQDIILNTPAENQIGLILEYTLLYPKSLHDYHIDYHLVPVRVQYSKLSPNAKEICDKHNLRGSTNSKKTHINSEKCFRYMFFGQKFKALCLA